MQTRGINSISRDYHVLRVRRLLPNKVGYKVGKGCVLRSGSQKRIRSPIRESFSKRKFAECIYNTRMVFDEYFFLFSVSLFLSSLRTPQFRRIVNRAPRNGLKDTKKAYVFYVYSIARSFESFMTPRRTFHPVAAPHG